MSVFDWVMIFWTGRDRLVKSEGRATSSYFAL
jgi:hypothetical protein